MKRVLGFLVLILALFGSGCLGWLGVGPGREPKLLLRLEEPFPGETVEIFLRTEGQEYLLVLKEEREQELTLEAGLWKIEAQARDSQGRLIGFSGEYPLHIEKKTHLLELGIELVDPRPALPQAVDLQARWEQEGVLLSWANKEKQGQWEVWRRRLESRLWKKIAVLPAEQASFSDTAISTGSAYEYALRYLDEESAPGPLGPEAATSRGTLKISWEFKHDYSFLPQEPAPRSLRIWSSLGPKSGFQDYIAYFQTEPAYERREDLLKEAGWKIKAELTSLAAVLVEPLKKSAPLRLEGDGFYLEPNWEIAAEEALLGLKSSFAWNLELIKLPLAWEISQGSRGLPIALLDSGLDPNFSGAAVYPGYNFVQGNRDTADDNGHGTQVAGILKQVVPRLGIIPVKVLDEKGSGNVFDLAAGLLFAAGLHDQLYNPYPAAVINLSLGQFNSSTILRGAIRHIAEKTAALLVAAAGNYDRPEVLYPAAYPEVIAVGAIAPAAGLPRRADYSNFGSGLDLTAPGGSREFPLESPGLPGRGREAAGTSFAAPHVSGVINLMLARGIEPSRIGPILEASAVDLGPAGWDGDYGHGLLNAYWALEEAVSFQVSVEKKAGGSWQQVKTFEKPLRDGELEPFVLAPGLYRVEAWLDMGKAGLLDRGDYYYRSPPLVLDDDSQVQAHLVLAELD